MKSIFRTALLAALAVAALGVTALAADTGGMYNVTKAGDYTETVTLTPQTAEGTTPGPGSITVDGGSYTDFYADTEKIQVTYTGAAEGDQYLVLALDDDSGVPREDNIVYIDQRAAGSDNSVTFTVYPGSLASGKTYGIYLSSSDGMSLTQVGSFDYYMPYTLGDVNEDEAINSTDALWVLQATVNNRTLTESQRSAADVDRNNAVNSTDALWILQATVGNREL